MSHALHHAMGSVQKYGGKVEDYLAIHEWFDAPKEHIHDFRHRMFRHHSQGINTMVEVFGPSLTNSDGQTIPTQWIGEQHLLEDFGFIPSPRDWVSALVGTESWMIRQARSGKHNEPRPSEFKTAPSN